MRAGCRLPEFAPLADVQEIGGNPRGFQSFGFTAAGKRHVVGTPVVVSRSMFDLFVEIQRYVDGVRVGVDFRFGARVFQVVEDAVLFDSLQEMIRVLDVERFARL